MSPSFGVHGVLGAELTTPASLEFENEMMSFDILLSPFSFSSTGVGLRAIAMIDVTNDEPLTPDPDP